MSQLWSLVHQASIALHMDPQQRPLVLPVRQVGMPLQAQLHVPRVQRGTCAPRPLSSVLALLASSRQPQGPQVMQHALLVMPASTPT